jgi:DNA-binding PadR family transcriptional regulator
MYTITEEGKEVLAIWIDYMKKQANTLNEFIAAYRKFKKQDK